jgi:hypothetical protein
LKPLRNALKKGDLGYKMNPDTAVNLIVDKHPFNTGTLLIMVVGAILIIYGVAYLILRKK